MIRKEILKKHVRVLKKARRILHRHSFCTEDIDKRILQLQTVIKRYKFYELAEKFDAPHISDVH